jgi:DNA topoisomerase-1
MTKKFASLMNDQNIGNITLEEVLDLFLLLKNLGSYKGKFEVSNGRLVRMFTTGDAFVSLAKGENPLDITIGEQKN